MTGPVSDMVLQMRAAEIARDGDLFYRSENGIWLTDTTCAPRYLKDLSD